MNIILIGPPGAGKGTQSLILEKKYNLKKISTGELVRREIDNKTTLGISIKNIVDGGKFPNDEIILNIVESEVSLKSEGLIFDGFPRTCHQAEQLIEMMSKYNSQISCVIELKVDPEQLIDRITSRYTCVSCGHIYNNTIKPKIANSCDYCKSDKFEHRNDDNAQSFKVRINTFFEMTNPVIAYYKEKNILYSVDGMQDVEKVTVSILKIIEDLKV